jgi:hypothetical protein
MKRPRYQKGQILCRPLTSLKSPKPAHKKGARRGPNLCVKSGVRNGSIGIDQKVKVVFTTAPLTELLPRPEGLSM